MVSNVTLRAWGNSLGIRIPKSILKKLGMEKSDELEITTQGESIILKKAFRHKTFKERLAEYDGKIDIKEFDWGDVKGREML